jgi:hypothetical protein
MRRLKLMIAGLLLTANSSCSFWYDGKLWTCQETQQSVWVCDSSDV